MRTASRLAGVGLLALLATAVVSGVWAALLTVNLRTTPALPWAPVVMAGLLWLAWQYAGGRGGPRRTSAARHALLRARRVEPSTFALALVAGGLGLIALAALWIVSFQTGLMRGNPLPDFSRDPPQTVAAVIAMAAVVGAVSEEAAFRGYLQGLLERHFSPSVSILLAALALAPGHASTQGLAWPTFGFYLLVDAMLGITAFLCDSILPGIVVHAAGLVLFFGLIWPGDPSRAIGPEALHDPWLWIHGGQLVVFAALAAVAYRHLASVRLRRSGNFDHAGPFL
jgi:membrane protease YdiL (CAAX protease family)